jgi:hypothetical protein
MSTNASNKAKESVGEADARGERNLSYGTASEKGKVQNTAVIDFTIGNQETAREVIIMKQWEDGTVYFIDPNHLDSIDRKRMSRALNRANKAQVELWTVLKDTSLSNGANGLDFFHQYVQTYRPAGATKAPDARRLTSIANKDRDLAIERARPELIRRG